MRYQSRRTLWSTAGLVLAGTLLFGSGRVLGDCKGDCDNNGQVTSDELSLVIQLLFASGTPNTCPGVAAPVVVADLLQVIRGLGTDCPFVLLTPTPPPTPTRTPTSSPTPTQTPLPGEIGERATLFLRCDTRYDAVAYCQFGTSAAPSFQPFILPQSLELSNLYVYCHDPIVTGTQSFAVHIQGATTNLGCSLSNGGQGCTDSDPAHTAHYAAGQELSLIVAGDAGATSTVCQVTMSAKVDAATEADAIFAWNYGADSQPPPGGFCGPGVGLTNDPTTCATTNVDDAAWPISSPGRISGLSVRVSPPVTAGTWRTFWVCKAGVGDGSCDTPANGRTDVEVRIDENTSEQTDTTCTQNCELAAGDRIVIKVDDAGGMGGPKKWHYAVTVAGVPAHLSFRAARSTQERFFNWMTSATDQRATVYPIDRPGILRNLFCTANGPPTKNTSFSVCAGTTDQPPCGAISCTMGTSDTACSDTVHSIPVAAGNLVSFSVGPSGGDNLQGCSVEIAPLPSSDSAIHESGAGKP